VDEIRALAACSAAELGERLAVLPGALLAAGADVHDLQPLAGRFAVDGETLCFLPRFPFVDGMSYALLVGVASREVHTIERPLPAAASTTDAVAIYPSAGVIPLNQLKLYVHFSGPMSEGWAARGVQVRRADDGAPLAGVFLPTETELWDREHRRLTLLLDPGRIKRGLVPNAEAGYPLSEGVPVVVSVDRAFRDAAGRPLRAGLARRYQVGPPLRRRIDPRAWRLDAPRAGTTEPLTVTFDRPLDHALLGRCLWLHDAAGTPLEGRATLRAGECGWQFTPAAPWAAGRHSLIVDPRLEDLAGNTLHRVFDRDLTRDAEAPAEPHPIAIAFTCEGLAEQAVACKFSQGRAR